jgi:hypothetical protein
MVSREANVAEARNERRRLLVERTVSDAGRTTRADAALLAVQSASAGVDDALAKLERQLADVQLRLSPERDQPERAAEAIMRKRRQRS